MTGWLLEQGGGGFPRSEWRGGANHVKKGERIFQAEGLRNTKAGMSFLLEKQNVAGV